MVVVWTRGRPRRVVHRAVDDRVEIGRQLIPDDPALATVSAVVRIEHSFTGYRVDLSPHPDELVELGGTVLTTAVSLPEPMLPRFLAVGSSVLAIVGDVEPFESNEPTSSIAPILQAVEQAANAEVHLSLKGEHATVARLARHYADKLGAHAWFRPGGDQHLDHFLSTRPPVRTIVLELSRPLLDHDLRAIENLLETDLRFVIVRRDDHYLEWLPPALAAETIEVPESRFDERVTAIADAVTLRHGDARLSASAVAALLEHAMRSDDERWRVLLERVLDAWNGTDELRGADLR